ncbi:MAG: hypothetical protein HY051_02385 [Candidatus Aenigmarchaeota archaeon]|nr:hypothetical protein [Candidatus Aenigmarchaeota archaeon]
MPQQCPNCSANVHLVQSTPTVILLCKGCGTFFDASLQPIGDLKTGLDMGRVPSRPKPMERPEEMQAAANLEEPSMEAKEEQKNERPVKRTENMASLLSGGGFSSEYGCPKCSNSMKSMASPVTGNTLYTCAKCGYTGTVYVKN